MRKLKKFTIGSSVALSDTQMAGITGGDSDPNVCHAKSYDSTCSGTCRQYSRGKQGYCSWDYNSHSCLCDVKQ